MIPLPPETYEKPIECEFCGHKWYETMHYEGFGNYFPKDNQELKCPECEHENAS